MDCLGRRRQVRIEPKMGRHVHGTCDDDDKNARLSSISGRWNVLLVQFVGELDRV